MTSPTLHPLSSYKWELGQAKGPYFVFDVQDPDVQDLKPGDLFKIDDDLFKTVRVDKGSTSIGIAAASKDYGETSSGATRWGLNLALLGGYQTWSDGSIDRWGSYERNYEKNKNSCNES